MEQIYFLEIFIDKVSIFIPEDDDGSDDTDHKFTVKVNFGPKVQFIIKEGQMAPTSPHDDIVICENTGKRKWSRTIRVGKSYLFPSYSDTILMILSKFPLELEVWNDDEDEEVEIFVGVGTMSWDPSFFHMLKYTSNPKKIHEPLTLKQVTTLWADCGCRQVGEVDIILRLTALGDSIITEFQEIQPDAFCFRTNKAQSMFRCKRNDGDDSNFCMIGSIYETTTLEDAPPVDRQIDVCTELQSCGRHGEGTDGVCKDYKADEQEYPVEKIKMGEIKGPCGNYNCPLAHKVRKYIRNIDSYKKAAANRPHSVKSVNEKKKICGTCYCKDDRWHRDSCPVKTGKDDCFHIGADGIAICKNCGSFAKGGNICPENIKQVREVTGVTASSKVTIPKPTSNITPKITEVNKPDANNDHKGTKVSPSVLPKVDKLANPHTHTPLVPGVTPSSPTGHKSVTTVASKESGSPVSTSTTVNKAPSKTTTKVTGTPPSTTPSVSKSATNISNKSTGSPQNATLPVHRSATNITNKTNESPTNSTPPINKSAIKISPKDTSAPPSTTPSVNKSATNDTLKVTAPPKLPESDSNASRGPSRTSKTSSNTTFGPPQTDAHYMIGIIQNRGLMESKFGPDYYIKKVAMHHKYQSNANMTASCQNGKCTYGYSNGTQTILVDEDSSNTSIENKASTWPYRHHNPFVYNVETEGLTKLSANCTEIPRETDCICEPLKPGPYCRTTDCACMTVPIITESRKSHRAHCPSYIHEQDCPAVLKEDVEVIENNNEDEDEAVPLPYGLRPIKFRPCSMLCRPCVFTDGHSRMLKAGAIERGQLRYNDALRVPGSEDFERIKRAIVDYKEKHMEARNMRVEKFKSYVDKRTGCCPKHIRAEALLRKQCCGTSKFREEAKLAKK